MSTNIQAPEFEAIKYSVYARANENGKVIYIFSNKFEQPLETDTLIKSGYGDEYIHVSYYTLLTKEGAHVYKIENKKLVECTEEEIEAEIAAMDTGTYVAELNELESISGGKLTEPGWYRIAKYPGGEGSKYANSCEISIKRTFINIENEYHNLRLVSVASLYEFQPIVSKSANQLIDQIRYTYDENNGYIEIYYCGNTKETAHISIIKGKDYNHKWTAIVPELTSESIDGVIEVCSYDILSEVKPLTSVSDIDAKTVGGYLPRATGKKGIPVISSDFGGLEIGSYIDFHTKDGQDFVLRLAIEDGKLVLRDPETGGNFVLTNSNIKNYALPIEGGVLGNKTWVTPLNIMGNETTSRIGFRNNKNEDLGFLGFDGSNNPVYCSSDAIYKLLHTGNMSLINGGNADTVDGKHATDLNENINEHAPLFINGTNYTSFASAIFDLYSKGYQKGELHIADYAPSDVPAGNIKWGVLRWRSSAGNTIFSVEFYADRQIPLYLGSLAKNENGNKIKWGGQITLLNDILASGLLGSNMGHVNITTDTFTVNDLLSRKQVTFFTNWGDNKNFPFVYGSGVMIPCLDASYKIILYTKASSDTSAAKFTAGSAKSTDEKTWTITWSEKADADKVLLKDGSVPAKKMTVTPEYDWGQYIFKSANGYYRALEADDGRVRIDVRDNDSAEERRYLDIANKIGCPDVKDALHLVEQSGGQTKGYQVLHTGNFPIEEGTFELKLYDGNKVFEGNYIRQGKIVHVYGSYKLPEGINYYWENMAYGLPFTVANTNLNFWAIDKGERNMHILSDYYSGNADDAPVKVNGVLAVQDDYVVNAIGFNSGETVRMSGIYITND